MEIDIKAELEQELNGQRDLEERIQKLDEEKGQLVIQLFRKQGIVQFLQVKLRESTIEVEGG